MLAGVGRVVVCVWKAGWCKNNLGGTGMGEAAERGGGGEEEWVGGGDYGQP